MKTDPNEFEYYTCNVHPINPGAEEITLCNALQYCDPETRSRRRCTKVVVIISKDPYR